MAGLILAVPIFVSLTAIAQVKDVAANPVFQKLVGEWTGEGKFTNADGGVDTFTEEVTASIDTTTGVFKFQGVQTMESLETSESTFSYYYNAALENYEAKYSDSRGIEITMEVQVDSAGESIVARGPLSSDGTSIEITGKFEGDDRWVAEISVTDQSGQETLTGVVTKTRVK